MRADNARALAQAVGGANAQVYNNAYNQAGNLTQSNIQNEINAEQGDVGIKNAYNQNLNAAISGQQAIQQQAQNVIGAKQNLFNANVQFPLTLENILMGYLG